MNFIQMLHERWRSADSLLCVGLDPDPAAFPAHLRGQPDALFRFCRAIVDATGDRVCAFKPQIAHFAALAGERDLERLIEHIHDAHPGVPVILDGKRGDIGSTAGRYAVEAFDRYRADAVTVNPYLGRDAVQPFLDRADRGVVILCRTSNPGAGDFQDMPVEGRPLFLHVAERIARDWNGNGNCALVVGATWPEQLAAVRATVGDLPILVPGIGAQGGDLDAVLAAGRDSRGTGLMISSSRAILYASDGPDFAEQARARAEALRTAINRLR
ncbi:MAG TPA: orotidine-5'-phosphate decarboxylase [Xanthomonadales bacterium]|nr:orotidine-5'-phosphate decarboxylase [Xanthomonadales bacterium]